MYTTSITYENAFGENVTEELNFNLTKAEILKLQVSVNGGFDKYMNDILASQDPAKVLNLFETMIKLSYGKRTAEGKFVKDEEEAKAFLTSEAYSALFMELLTDENKQQAFFLGIMPKDLAAAAQKEIASKAAVTE